MQTTEYSNWETKNIVCNSIAVVFAMGSKMYRKPPPEGNIVAQVTKCIWFAICNRFRNRSEDIPKRQHWLDWAAEKYPKHLIMDVKALTRILFLYIPLPMFWALLDQQGSRWTLQANKMDGDLGFFCTSAGSDAGAKSLSGPCLHPIVWPCHLSADLQVRS